MQFEILTSMKSLHKHIDSSQLPLELEGTFPYCHRDWLSFRMVSGCLVFFVAGNGMLEELKQESRACEQLSLQAQKGSVSCNSCACK